LNLAILRRDAGDFDDQAGIVVETQVVSAASTLRVPPAR
jgi:hypothetical protein